MDEFYNKYYIRTREDGCIVDGWSDGPLPGKSTEGAILFNETGTYQFRLEPNGEENPALTTFEGVPLYKYEDGKAEKRSDEDIQAEIDNLPPPDPSPMEQLRADVDFLLIMEDML